MAHRGYSRARERILELTMDDIQAAIRDLERLCDAVDELGEALRYSKKQYRKALRSLQEGVSVEAALGRADSANTRTSLTLALAAFEKRRHSSRMSLICAGASQGSSINSISKSWGISRQLASRYVNLVRTDPKVR
jgi:hypothetical protein